MSPSGSRCRGVLAQWRANLIDYLLFCDPGFSRAVLHDRCSPCASCSNKRVAHVAVGAPPRGGPEPRRCVGGTRAEDELHQAQKKWRPWAKLTGGGGRHDFNNLLTVLQGLPSKC